MAESRLFSPLRIGNVEVKHRVAMPSLTRQRASDDRIPSAMMKEYYSQRAAVPGTLIVTEGTFMSPICGGFPNAPGIWSKEQADAWRSITDEVHRKGCFIFCQLFSMGRGADVETSTREGVEIIGPSAIPHEEGAPVPRAMTIEEVRQTVKDFGSAAKNAIEAGFDGVECHVANGYLLEQFVQDVSNTRDDEYGGSIENRARFANEAMEAMVDAVGAERVGLRLSPWSKYLGMGMKDPIPQFTAVINKAKELKLAYLHLVEPRVDGASDTEEKNRYGSLDFAYNLWNGVFLVAGGYNPEQARKLVDEEHPDKDIVVMFGRYFVSNPDLVYRIKQGLTLSAYDRATFYSLKSALGYSDYPYSKEYLAGIQA